MENLENQAASWPDLVALSSEPYHVGCDWLIVVLL